MITGQERNKIFPQIKFSKQDRGFVASNQVAVILNEGKLYISMYAVKASSVCYKK
jgi:hypothetical protein